MEVGCPRAFVLLGCLLLSCGSGPTSVRVEIDAAPGTVVSSLQAQVALDRADAGAPQMLPASGAAPRLPGTVLIPLPDRAAVVTVTLDAETQDGRLLHATGEVESVPHKEVPLTLVLGEGAPDDLAMPAPPDAGTDAAGDGAPACAGPRCVYAYRRRITITNGSGQPLPAGYTVRVVLPLGALAKARKDLQDLRVFADAPDQELDRVIDVAPPGQSPALFLALDAPISAGASDSRYWLYYGDPSPNVSPAPSAGNRVFLFYDDFSSVSLASHWVKNGAPTLAGGVLTLRQGQQDAIATLAASDGIPIANVLEARVSVSDPQSAPQVVPQGSFYYWLGYQRAGDFSPQSPWIVWIARGPGTVQAEENGTTSCPSGSPCVSGAFAQQQAAFRWYRIERAPTETRFYLDGTLDSTITDVNDTDFSLMFRNWALTSDLAIDWVRVRRLATPEPSVTVGVEQPGH